MPHPHPDALFARLHDLGIISPELCRQALAHPRLAELFADASPAQALAWMVFVDLYPEERFLQDIEARGHAASLADESRQEAAHICREALGQIQAIKGELNERIFNGLLQQGLINEDQRAAALAALPEQGEAFASPAAALVWMVSTGLIGDEEWLELRVGVDRTSGFAADVERARLVAEAEALLDTVNAALMSAQRRTFWSAVFPLPTWLWLGGGALALAGLVWYLLQPSAPPDCDDGNVRDTLNTMMFKYAVSSNVGLALLGRESLSSPRVISVKEIGYARNDKVRACLATLKMDGEAMPYAFTIDLGRKGEPEAGGGYRIVGAQQAIVEARFSKFDAEGDYAVKAAPIGRANVENAFRSGVDALRKASGGTPSDTLERLRRQREESALNETDPDREREIAEVEPLADCQTVTPGQRYRCRLLIEHNDPFLAELGATGSTVFEGDFHFERTPDGRSWRVSERFADEVTEAVASGRVGIR